MTSRQSSNAPHSPQVTRRELLQVGYSGLLGIGLPSLFTGRALAAEASLALGSVPPTSKSVILVFLTGGASHIDTFDMKPEAGPGIRGEFQPIATPVPGLHVCEHLPNLAARADKYAIVRNLSHSDNNHLVSTHHVLTGHQQPGAFFDKIASRDDWPSYASACDYLKPRNDAIPTGVNLPTFLRERVLVWPGQHAGFLGTKHDPWQIVGNPNAPDFKVDALRLAPGIDVDRFENRQALLAQFDREQERFAEITDCRRLTNQQQLAFSMLSTSKLAQAFELNRETAETRDRYGRHTFGQSLLLAKRLNEAGVPIVQANMGAVQNWDSHSNIFETLKGRLLPPLDQGMAALLDDLEASGRIDETLVVMLGEFGRSPKLSIQRGQTKAGRDHWGPCNFALFAGGGVRGGLVLGESDRIGAYPESTPYSPNDLGATVHHMLGVNPASEIRDRLGRPVPLNHGTVMEALFTGASV